MKTKPKIEIDLNEVEDLASRGLTKQQIADKLGISERTLYTRQSESAEFAEAIKRGGAKGVAFASNKLFEAVERGEAWAICFFLKTKGGFKETQKVEMTADVKTTEVELTNKQKATLDRLLDEDY